MSKKTKDNSNRDLNRFTDHLVYFEEMNYIDEHLQADSSGKIKTQGKQPRKAFKDVRDVED